MKTDDSDFFEGTYVGIRGEMRSLRGKLDTYLSVERPGPVEGFTSAEVKSLREMRKILNRCLGMLDRYEDLAEYYDEAEKTTEWLWDLSRRVGKHEER